MKLYLMRHGEATDPQLDPERGLTPAGRVGIERIARQLTEKGVHVEQVFHSNKTRARQTAEIVADAVAAQVELREHEHIKPNDDPAILLDEIQTWQDNTLIAGHLPYIPDLLIQLVETTQGINFEPGTVVCLDKQADHNWQLEWFISPSQLL